MADVEAKYRPHLESLLEHGEELRGICVASQQKGLFKGGAVALGVSDRRLLVQPLDRSGDPDGDPGSIASADVASAKAGGAGGGWWSVPTGILDHAAVRLEIKKTDGEKLKLMMMRGEGKLLGGLGGGDAQRQASRPWPSGSAGSRPHKIAHHGRRNQGPGLRRRGAHGGGRLRGRRRR